jgi:hypothetical protein
MGYLGCPLNVAGQQIVRDIRDSYRPRIQAIRLMSWRNCRNAARTEAVASLWTVVVLQEPVRNDGGCARPAASLS